MQEFYARIVSQATRTFGQASASAIVWLCCCGVSSATEFPYVAYVTSPEAYVRSGPGQDYYPTEQLQQGYAVEVYRHDGSGWCAIRPPEGSFSLVPSHQVRELQPRVVEIMQDQVVARVGSRLSNQRSAVQVLLPRGERLQALPTDEDDPRWVRIAAPAGEFRWIAAEALSREPPLETQPVAKPLPGNWTRQSPHRQAVQESEPDAFSHLGNGDMNEGLQFGAPQLPTVQQTQPQLAQHTEPIQETNSLVTTDPNALQVVSGSPAEQQWNSFPAQQPALTTAPPTMSQATSQGAAQSAAQPSPPRVRFDGKSTTVPVTVRGVEQLELKLSQTVVQPPEQWQLAPLEAAGNQLMEATSDPAQRALLREVMGRIAKFQEIQQRYQSPTLAGAGQDPFDSPFAETPVADSQAPQSTEITGMTSDVRDRIRADLETPFQPTPSSDPTQSPFDATGMLKPVVSKRPEAPQYALVDESGKVTAFVTPTPDLNLKPYVGQQIGVSGKRGYMPEYRRAHVTAGRVQAIDGTIRR